MNNYEGDNRRHSYYLRKYKIQPVELTLINDKTTSLSKRKPGTPPSPQIQQCRKITKDEEIKCKTCNNLIANSNTQNKCTTCVTCTSKKKYLSFSNEESAKLFNKINTKSTPDDNYGSAVIYGQYSDVVPCFGCSASTSYELRSGNFTGPP